MPIIYLSPSTQDWNPYLSGGTEEQYMNLVADAMEPYLRASGIEFTRNRPEMTAASSIRESNAGDYALHVALHSNAAPEGKAGTVRGSEVYYYPGSTNGKRFADLVAAELKKIYPNPDKVRVLTTTRLGEVSKTRAPGVLIEFAYHDNPEDEAWIKNHIPAMARAVSAAIAQYFGLPLNEPEGIRSGVVRLQSGSLNVRERPSLSAPVIGSLFNGETVSILGQRDNWYVIRRGNWECSACAECISEF